jgi:hypothetical protein
LVLALTEATLLRADRERKIPDSDRQAMILTRNGRARLASFQRLSLRRITNVAEAETPPGRHTRNCARSCACSCACSALPNSAVFRSSAAPTAPHGPASAPRSALEGPRGARRATPDGTTDQQGSVVTRPGAALGRLPGAPVSRSRPPCLGRSLRSRRTRSATPNLDTAPARKGSAPIRKTGEG